MLGSDYLSSKDEPTEKIRCPVHGFIRYSINERSILDHWTFQRLRHIRQLAMTYLVYPGAMHSRFEHSLGVMELATQAFDSVVRKQRSKVEAELKQSPPFQDCTIAKARQIVRLLALLHDVGHPAFSHAAESIVPGKDHELLSEHVIREILGRRIDSMLFAGASELLALLLRGSGGPVFLRQFVTGEMDMDRADYLRRDSLHCGVTYGVFDVARLIESLSVVENPDTGQLQLAICRGGEHTFEALILARYQMNTQVYFHKIRRIYDYYLEEYMKLWGAERTVTNDLILKHADVTMLTQIKADATTDTPRSRWAKHIVDRRHHKVVFETGDSADLAKFQQTKRMLKRLQNEFKDVEFYFDDRPVSIYKLSIPGDQEEQKVEDLYILEKDGRIKLLAHESAIISKIPRRVRTVRIFVDAPASKLAGIRTKVKELESSV